MIRRYISAVLMLVVTVFSVGPALALETLPGEPEIGDTMEATREPAVPFDERLATGKVVAVDRAAGRITLEFRPIPQLFLEGGTRIFRVGDPASLFAWTNQQFDPTLSWADVEWIKKRWGGKLILKGIMDVEDARLAANSGADALIVSNHGGRQLDGAPSSIEALPAIVAAVGKEIEVWMDGGIRSGQDVLKAVALGARGTMIGRPFLYGLGAMGEQGVARCLEVLRNEMDITMAFCGHRDVRDVTRDILLPGTFPT